MANEKQTSRIDRFEAMLVSNRESVANVLRERIYATLTGIATLVVLIQQDASISAWRVAGTLALTMGVLWIASLVSDFIAAAATHSTDPGDERESDILHVAGQSIETMLIPLIVILLSLTRIWSVRTGMILAVVAMVLTIVGVSWLAVRRSSFGFWTRVGIMVVELALALAVVVAKMLEH